jgi:hypothetical protein
MKRLVIVSGVALAVVVGISIYAHLALEELKQHEESLAQTYEDRAAALRGLDERFPYTPRETLDPARFTLYLEARGPAARYFENRLEESTSRDLFHAYESRNEVLRILAAELEPRSMSLREYVAISRRWQALLARGEPARLRAAWNRVVVTRDHPRGLPLPEAAPVAGEAELALLGEKAGAIEKTLHADLVGPTLERIERGES